MNKPNGWPEPMVPEAFHGLAGEVINTIKPHTEADPNGLLVQLLVAIGNAIGPSPFYRLEATQHRMNLFAVIVGDTAKSRKGTSWGWINRFVKMADDGWGDCIASGCSSGEGIIYHVRDEEDGNEPDRRLMVVEGEFAQILKVARRDGNTLSPVLRNAWDGSVLRTLTRNSPLKSTGAHISIVGHITQDELLKYLSETEVANGLGNRFLWASVTRSQLLPFGGDFDDSVLIPLASRLRDVFMQARKGGTVHMDKESRVAWHYIYKMLADCPSGIVGAMTARAEAQIIRLACLYALLDQTMTINPDHLLAAKAVWMYCDRSVRHIFSSVTGDRIADKILVALDECSKISRTTIRDLGNRHWSKSEIDNAIELLAEDYGVTTYREPSGGRSVEWIMREVVQ